MKFYYYEGSERKGPVTSVELRQLASQGKITQATVLETQYGLKVSGSQASVAVPGLFLGVDNKSSNAEPKTNAAKSNAAPAPSATPETPYSEPVPSTTSPTIDLAATSIDLTTNEPYPTTELKPSPTIETTDLYPIASNEPSVPDAFGSPTPDVASMYDTNVVKTPEPVALGQENVESPEEQPDVFLTTTNDLKSSDDLKITTSNSLASSDSSVEVTFAQDPLKAGLQEVYDSTQKKPEVFQDASNYRYTPYDLEHNESKELTSSETNIESLSAQELLGVTSKENVESTPNVHEDESIYREEPEYFELKEYDLTRASNRVQTTPAQDVVDVVKPRDVPTTRQTPIETRPSQHIEEPKFASSTSSRSSRRQDEIKRKNAQYEQRFNDTYGSVPKTRQTPIETRPTQHVEEPKFASSTSNGSSQQQDEIQKKNAQYEQRYNETYDGTLQDIRMRRLHPERYQKDGTLKPEQENAPQKQTDPLVGCLGCFLTTINIFLLFCLACALFFNESREITFGSFVIFFVVWMLLHKVKKLFLRQS